MIDKDSALIVSKFYSAFQSKDVATMTHFYHDEARFSDPAFGELNAKEVRAMWTMLCSSSDDLAIEFEILSAEKGSVSSKWHAYYSFGKSKRNVHNIIYSSIQVKEGKIYSHKDEFDLYRWAKQALGKTGLLIGWTSFFKKNLNKKTKDRLAKYMAKS